MKANTKVYESDTYKSFASVESSKEPKNDFQAFVRYANKNAKQNPKIDSVGSEMPENACYTSPIYYLEQSEIDKQGQLPTGYEMSDSSIADKLQNKAEKEGRVFYPIYVESDAKVPLDRQIEWIEQFLQEDLGISPGDCTWFYSGGGSIHCHVPRLATERNIDRLRELGQSFEHNIDPSVFSRKRQFRLPGVIHSDTDFPKVKIDREWSHERIIREAATSDRGKPESFSQVLTDTFPSDVLERPEDHLLNSIGVDPCLHDWEEYSPGMRTSTFSKWKMHYSHPVSPYAKAGNGNRSLLIAQVKGGAFGEKRDSHREKEEKQSMIFLPCHVLRFFGCEREFSVDKPDYRPVQLSKRDYEKISEMDISEKDYIVLIGGQSRKSRIYNLEQIYATAIAGSKDFSDAMSMLKSLGYETGKSGYVAGNYENNYNYEYEQGNDKELTRAYRVQKKAEKEGIESLNHIERLIVMLRQLSIKGVEGTRGWFQEQYGSDFKADVTNKHIKSACESFDWAPEYSTS